MPSRQRFAAIETNFQERAGASRPVFIVEVETRACPLRQLLRGVLQYLPHNQHARFRPRKMRRPSQVAVRVPHYFLDALRAHLFFRQPAEA